MQCTIRYHAGAMELSPEQQDTVLRLAVDGESMRTICGVIGISRHQMWRYREKYPTFDHAVTRAQMEGVEAQTDLLLSAHEDYKDPQRAKVMSDNVKWLASRRKPETYGDRLDLNVTERVDVGGALIEARKRAALPVCDQESGDDAQVAEYREISDGRTNGCEPVGSEQDEGGLDIFS